MNSNARCPLIGLDMIRSLALSLGVLKGFSSGVSQTGFSLDNLWMHSLAVGNGCNDLARKLGRKSEHLFITGFLHDIGKLVLDRFMPDEFKACLEASAAKGLPMCELEREAVGMDHGEIGAILLEKWQFPEIIIEPVRYHHAPESTVTASKSDLAMIRVLDGLCHHLGVYAEPHDIRVPIYGSDLKKLGLKKEVLMEFSQNLKSKVEENQALYSAMA